jgi:spore maturation protein CgeB
MNNDLALGCAAASERLKTPLKIRLFCHSIISDWNNGHAHFFRGIVGELSAVGHDVVAYEDRDCWSLKNALSEREDVISEFHRRFPELQVHRYSKLDLARTVADADLVIVHEWNPPGLIAELGRLRARHNNFRLLFHDSHHRAVTNPSSMAAFDLRHFDGVLAFGEILSEMYRQKGWARNAWTWHEGADTRLFRPMPGTPQTLDLVWIGNWGDGERSEELLEFLIQPVKQLGLRAAVFGVRYAPEALEALASASITYGGWLANADAPATFAQARVTVHVPRRPYARQLHGIPTIRPFEAMACGIPLISGPWQDSENLFSPGADFIFAENGAAMTNSLDRVLSNPKLSRRLATTGLQTVTSRHSCAHRAEELLRIYEALL